MILTPNNFKSTFSRGLNSKILISSDEIDDLAEFLAAPVTSGGGLLAMFTNPNDYISSVIMYPINFDLHNVYSGDLAIWNGISNITSTITGKYIDRFNGYYRLGQWECKRKFNNYADYEGYTTIKLFLPFLGFVDISPNDVMGKWIQLRLQIDYNTGQGCYLIGVSETKLENTSSVLVENDGYDLFTRIISTHSFQLGINIPIGSSDSNAIYRNIMSGLVRKAGRAIGSYIGNVSGAVVGEAVGGTISETIEKSGEIAPRKTPLLTGHIPISDEVLETSVNYSSVRMTDTGCKSLISSGESLKFIGITGETTNPNNPAVFSCSPLKPFVVIYRPKFTDSVLLHSRLYGRPLGETKTLKDLSGYTEISQFHLEGYGFSSATEAEKDMLNAILRSGVILPDVETETVNITYYTDYVELTTKPLILYKYDLADISFKVLEKGTLSVAVENATYSSITYNDISQDVFPTSVDVNDVVKFTIANPTQDVRIIIIIVPEEDVEPIPVKTFKIGASTYAYEDGMTWRDFINSEYNDGNFETYTSLISYILYKEDAVYTNSYYVRPDTLIESKAYYYEDMRLISVGKYIFKPVLTAPEKDIYIPFKCLDVSSGFNRISSSGDYISFTNILSGSSVNVYNTNTDVWSLPDYRNIEYSGTDFVPISYYNWFTNNTTKIEETEYDGNVQGTWVFNDVIVGADIEQIIDFRSLKTDGEWRTFDKMTVERSGTSYENTMITYTTWINNLSVYNNVWLEEGYKTVEFISTTSSSSAFHKWLAENATKQS